MRPGSSLTVSAPSSSLLRFLKSQSEELCFFTPSRGLTCQNARTGRKWTASRNARRDLPNSIRWLTTTSPRQAVVESSLLNFDILRPPPKRPPPPANALRHESWTGTFGNHTREISSHSRYASTDPRPWLHRLWKQKERKEKINLRPTELPPLPSFLDDVGGTSLGRKKPGKAANELKLRCTEFDNEGKVTLMDGEFKKTALIAKVELA